LHDLERRFKVMSPEVLERVVSRKVLSRLSDEDLVVCEQVLSFPEGEEFTDEQRAFLDRHEQLLKEARLE
jgi:hypothetical protein